MSIRNLERRAVFGPGPPVVVDAGGRDVGVAKPFLHLGDIGLVIKRVGGGRGTQRVGTDLEAEQGRIGAHQPVNAVPGDRPFKPAGAVVADRAEQRNVSAATISRLSRSGP